MVKVTRSKNIVTVTLLDVNKIPMMECESVYDNDCKATIVVSNLRENIKKHKHGFVACKNFIKYGMFK